MSPLPRETAFAMRLAPGESADLTWRIDDAPPEPSLVASIANGDGAVSLISLHAFRQIRVPYSEDELAEFPRPMRERLRREGRIELIDDGTAGPGVPLAVRAGGSVEARVEVSAGSIKGQFVLGEIHLEGTSWGRVTARVAAVVGSGGTRVRYEPEQLRMLVAPGHSTGAALVVPQPPVEARAVAILDSPSGDVTIQSVSAFRTDRVPATPEELAELPPALREKVAQSGFEVLTEVASVQEGEPVTVPAGGSLQVNIQVTAPQGPPRPMEATLVVVSNRWEIIRVPVLPIASAVEVELESARVEVEQGGEPATVPLLIRARGFPPSLVELTLGDEHDAWHLEPRTTSVPANGQQREILAVSAAADAPLGQQQVDLFVHWFGGLGSTFLPLTLDVRPGRVDVAVLTQQIAGPQGGTAAATVRVTTKSAKTVRFRPAYLPPGIEMLPVDRIGFAAGTHEIPLQFRIDAAAVAGTNQRIAVAWDAADAVHSGVLELRLTTVLVPAERRWERAIVTPPGMPLGGRVAFTLTNDGRGRFSGHMRATGALSFEFRLIAVLRSADGLIAVLEEEHGEVHGTFDPGSREHAWDRPLSSGFVPEWWKSLANADVSVARGTEISGIFGAAVDRIRDLVDTVAGLGVMLPLVPGGPALVALVVASSDLRELTKSRVIGPDGHVGVLATAAGAALLGPGAIIPVFLGAGAVTGLTVKHREVSPAEQAFAREVFGDTLPWERILLTNLVGASGRPFTCPNADGQILVNIGSHLFEHPSVTRALGSNGQPKDWVPGQTFIHELVHAWQIAHGAFDAAFLARAIKEQLLDGDDAYLFGPAGPPLSDFGIEGAASLVEQWFAGRRLSATEFAPAMSTADPYFRYIAGNIRIGVP